MKANRAIVVATFVLLGASAPALLAQTPAADTGDKAAEQKKDSPSTERFNKCREGAERRAPSGSTRRKYMEDAIAECREQAKKPESK
jgi:hypothetical protein